MLIVSVILALLSAMAFAFSTVRQQGITRATALRHGTSRRSWLPVLGFFRRMVHQPAWRAGWLLSAAGFIGHAAALHLGAIAVVQAVLVGQLLAVLIISAVRRHLRPTPRDWAGAVAICAGIVTLVLLRGDVEQHAAPRGAIPVFSGVVVAVLITIVTVARLLRRAQVRTRSPRSVLACASVRPRSSWS